jgi:outer membrane protein assembly factor BamA
VRALRRLLSSAAIAWTLASAPAHAGPPEPAPSTPRPSVPPGTPLPDDAPTPDDDVVDETPIAPPPSDVPTPAAPPERPRGAPGEPMPDPLVPEEAPPEAPPPAEVPPSESPTPDDAPPMPTEVDLTDALAPVDAALDALRAEGFDVGEPERTTNPLQGDVLTVRVRGENHDYLRYVLEAVAGDGYLVLLRATARDEVEIVALRARPGQERGLTYIGVAKVDIAGTFRARESAATLGKLIEYGGGLLIPIEVVDVMRSVGYRAELHPVGPDHVEIRVAPGRSIRRVRVHKYLPLAERDVRRVLSASSRPGALAPPCVSAKQLRRGDRPPVCAEGDLVCQAWESAERSRIERYLFDEGFLRGTVKFGLACGHKGDDATLHVYLDKGPGFRVRDPKVTGNLGQQDSRWVRRVFRPKFGVLLQIPKRITRKHVEQAKERVAREYASPRTGPASSRRQLTLPYPGVRVETSFDRLRRDDVPKTGRKIPLVVDVQLGRGVQTDFLFEERVSDARLRDQLQLFERREAPTTATARREAANLRSYLQSRGFMLAAVRGKYIEPSGLAKLTFEIDEGPRVRIRELDMPRPKSVPRQVVIDIEREYQRNRELRDGGRFTDVGARKDLGALLAAYAKRGYLCATGRVRVAFWREGLGATGPQAQFDLSSELEDGGEPAWIRSPPPGSRAFDDGGLQAIRSKRRAGAYLVVEIEPGPRVVTSPRETIHHLEQQIPASRDVGGLPETQGAWGAPRILRDGPLRRKGDERVGGIPVTLTRERDAERDIVTRYRGSGYPLADSEVRWVYTDEGGTQHRVATGDRLAEPATGLCEERKDADVALVDTEVYVYEGRRARFGTTLVRGNFKTREWVLRREIDWKEGDSYSRPLVDRTQQNIDGIGVTETIVIREQQRNCELDAPADRSCVVHHVIAVTESKDRAMDLTWGFGGQTLDPAYVFVRPSFPNMWGTAWDLALDGHVGANLPALRDAFCQGESCYERTGRITLTRRRIGGSPLTFDITGQIQRRVTPARGQIDSALGHVRLTWPINRRWQVYGGYLVQIANISKDAIKPTLGLETGCGQSGTASCRPPNRGEAIVPDRTAALQTGVRWERVDNAFNPNDGFIATGDAMWASPYFGGRDWWLRFDFTWEHFIPIKRTDKRLNFRYALTYGHEIPLPGLPGAHTTGVPEVWRYFGGGTRDLGIRGILPNTMLVDIEEIRGPHGTATLRPTAVGGHIRALGTIALQVTSVRNLLGGSLAHSVFVDFGVLTQRWRQVAFNRDFRRSVGINFIKWDIRIVSLSLGYAVLVPNWIWPGNVRPTDDRNGRFVFDVGATF